MRRHLEHFMGVAINLTGVALVATWVFSLAWDAMFFLGGMSEFTAFSCIAQHSKMIESPTLPGIVWWLMWPTVGLLAIYLSSDHPCIDLGRLFLDRPSTNRHCS